MSDFCSLPVKKILVNPITGKREHRVYVEGKGWYGWNAVYHVYNSVTNYEQLQNGQVRYILLNTTLEDEEE